MRRISPLLGLALLVACTTATDPLSEPQPLLAEAGAPPRLHASWPLFDGAAVRLEDGRLSLEQGPDSWPVATDVIGVPTLDAEGTRFVYCRQAVGLGLSSIEAWGRTEDGSWDGPRVLDDHADRPAISPDGERVAFVSGRTGVASIWLVPFAGGEAMQLTNVALEDRRVPGQPPDGFVAPPHQGPPRFDGDALVWDAPDGHHRVVLP
jgi:hypothetical protein